METYRWRPTRCKICKRRSSKRCHISARGLCKRCAMVKIGQSHEQMRHGEGEMAEKWARRRAAGIARYAKTLQGS